MARRERHSGPASPSVSNAWSASSWNQFLAQNGVIVLQVKVRPASGKDFEFVLYPQSRHGLARDLRTWDRGMTWRQILEHLLGEE